MLFKCPLTMGTWVRQQSATVTALPPPLEEGQVSHMKHTKPNHLHQREKNLTQKHTITPMSKQTCLNLYLANSSRTSSKLILATNATCHKVSEHTCNREGGKNNFLPRGTRYLLDLLLIFRQEIKC